MMREFFKDEIDYNGFFPMPRTLFQYEELKDISPIGPWAELSLAAKSVLPVILAHMFINESCCPGIRRISAFAGISKNTVTRGVADLKALPEFTVRKILTRQGKYKNIYSFKKPVVSIRGSWFPFHRCIVQSGNWALLTPAAKALYCTMRHWAQYDMLSEQTTKDGSGFAERQFDTCNAQRNILAECAGITTRSVRNALKDLENCGLIQRVQEIDDDGYAKLFEPDEDAWCVFLRPARLRNSMSQ